MGDTVTRYKAGDRPDAFWVAMGPVFASGPIRKLLETLRDEPDTDDWFFTRDVTGAIDSFACLRRGKSAKAELCHCYTRTGAGSSGFNPKFKTAVLAAAKDAGVKTITALVPLSHKPGYEKAGFAAAEQQPKNKWNYSQMERAV